MFGEADIDIQEPEVEWPEARILKTERERERF
jgi:hypothetical protein